MSEKFEKVDAVAKFADFIATALENDVPAWVQPWQEIDSVYRNYESDRPYSGFHNTLSLSVSMLKNNWNDPRFLTFNQVRKLGGNVVKGSKGTPVIFWQFYPSKDTSANGKPKMIPFAKSYTLFNVAQIEGVELKALPAIQKNDINHNDSLLNILDKCGITLKEQGDKAFYRPGKAEICIPAITSFHSADFYHATLAHEIVHAVIKSVEGKECEGYGSSDEARGEEELVAELGAFMLCRSLRLNGHMDDQHLAYVKGWARAIKDKGGKWLYAICKKADKRVQFILEQVGEKVEEEEGELAAV